ncbi:hypothetical protein CHPC973_001196 [Lactococcus phage CHPC973]|uniref:Uncharacterized protein n=1 Tax=Lactococcus phage CHPC973 TaxID=2675261 RepID=A0A650EVG9_9CAUD|nr:hypothetical protein CHPC973_001196 [Lactococcus phage CHPC973]
MRTYENLLKRINLVETAFDEVPKNLDYKNAILAYRMQAYLKRSYKTLALNGIEIEEV